MAWEGKRRGSLPNNWRTVRAQILARDPRCRLNLDGCTTVSTEVDHAGAPWDHRPTVLRGVCSPCHKQRTQEQARAARRTTRRPPEAHPGLL